jgi:hypothetical protein
LALIDNSSDQQPLHIVIAIISRRWRGRVVLATLRSLREGEGGLASVQGGTVLVPSSASGSAGTGVAIREVEGEDEVEGEVGKGEMVGGG